MVLHNKAKHGRCQDKTKSTYCYLIISIHKRDLLHSRRVRRISSILLLMNLSMATLPTCERPGVLCHEADLGFLLSMQAHTTLCITKYCGWQNATGFAHQPVSKFKGTYYIMETGRTVRVRFWFV
jgi:hypothetical protein